MLTYLFCQLKMTLFLFCGISHGNMEVITCYWEFHHRLFDPLIPKIQKSEAALDVLVVRRALSRCTWCSDNLPPKLFEICFLGVFKYTECDYGGFIAKTQFYSLLWKFTRNRTNFYGRHPTFDKGQSMTVMTVTDAYLNRLCK